MLIGKVVGTVVATQKDEKMEGMKFLVLKQVDTEGREGSGYIVAVDAMGAGLDEMVLYASGSSARPDHCHRQTALRRCDHGDHRPMGGRRRGEVSQGDRRVPVVAMTEPIDDAQIEAIAQRVKDLLAQERCNACQCSHGASEKPLKEQPVQDRPERSAAEAVPTAVRFAHRTALDEPTPQPCDRRPGRHLSRPGQRRRGRRPCIPRRWTPPRSRNATRSSLPCATAMRRTPSCWHGWPRRRRGWAASRTRSRRTCWSSTRRRARRSSSRWPGPATAGSRWSSARRTASSA